MEWQKKKKGLKIIYKALDRTQKIEQHELGEGEVRYSGRIEISRLEFNAVLVGFVLLDL